MFRRAAVGALLVSGPLAAQAPLPPQTPAPPLGPSAPVTPASVSPMMPVGPSPLGQPGRILAPGEPQQFPPNLVPGQTPDGAPTLPGNPTVQLPLPENLRRIDHPTVTVRRHNESWQLWAGGVLFRDFGPNQAAAEEAQRVIRLLRPTEWGVIGTQRSVVEYGLTNGQAATWGPSPKWSLRVDLGGVRAEEVRGAWVLRDHENILLNFGRDRADAEQAAAVCRRYGFNRVGLVGFPTPVMAYLYAAPAAAGEQKSAGPLAALSAAAQEQQMTRTGVPVPGIGFVGERLVIDPRKLDVRRDRNEWVVAAGPDVLARFGASDWAARDAKKVLQDMRVTEVCAVGGVTFFLSNGVPPSRVPFSVQGTRFDPHGLKARPAAGRWGVYEATGKELVPATTEQEAEQLVKLIQAFGFDQVCQVGTSPRASLRFLAKAGR